MSKKSGVIFTVVLCMAVVGGSSATTVKKMDLDELTQRSDSIVVGQATQIENKTVEETGSYPETHTTFTVLETLYGDEDVQELTVATIGGPVGNGMVTKVPGMPSFEADEKAVLFLVHDSEKGVSIPTGLSQGVFRIKVDPDTEREYIVNQSVDLGVSNVRDFSSQANTKSRAENLNLSQFRELVRYKVSKLKKEE